MAVIGRFLRDPGANSRSLPGRAEYRRWTSGNEVDFVVYGHDGFWAVEVKHSATIRPADLRGLRAFREDYPEATLRLLYRGQEALEVDGILCLPCEDFLLRLVPGEPLP